MRGKYGYAQVCRCVTCGTDYWSEEEARNCAKGCEIADHLLILFGTEATKSARDYLAKITSDEHLEELRKLREEWEIHQEE